MKSSSLSEILCCGEFCLLVGVAPLMDDFEIMFRIGIDLGGTKIEGVILDADGKEVFRKRIATEREHGYQHILNRIKTVHDELVAAVRLCLSSLG